MPIDKTPSAVYARQREQQREYDRASLLLTALMVETGVESIRVSRETLARAGDLRHRLQMTMYEPSETGLEFSLSLADPAPGEDAQRQIEIDMPAPCGEELADAERARGEALDEK